MAMNQATLKNVIKAALLANYNPAATSAQQAQADTLANAIASGILAFNQSITCTHVLSLVAPSGGGPVTGSITTTIS